MVGHKRPHLSPLFMMMFAPNVGDTIPQRIKEDCWLKRPGNSHEETVLYWLSFYLIAYWGFGDSDVTHIPDDALAPVWCYLDLPVNSHQLAVMISKNWTGLTDHGKVAAAGRLIAKCRISFKVLYVLKQFLSSEKDWGGSMSHMIHSE